MKSLDVTVGLIAHYIHDALASHGVNARAITNTINHVRRRTLSEGMGFLMKTLPRLGKCLDKALTTSIRMNCSQHGWKPMRNSELPILFGELFIRVFDSDGVLLPSPDTTCVRTLRGLFNLFYKLDLPCRSDQERAVIDQFVKTDQQLEEVEKSIDYIERHLDLAYTFNFRSLTSRVFRPSDQLPLVLRRAKILLSRVFSRYDPRDIVPRHGPGAVATKQQLREKYRWTNISAKLTEHWELDAYFYASLNHVCDAYGEFSTLRSETLPARVILVPKDSRGPRLISCEPVDFQWIQQGLQKSLYALIESHPLTKRNVLFTNQEPNRQAALRGSIHGQIATLDLKEASDRVSVRLVTALFPEHISKALLAARTDRTQLPDGSIMNLRKFAPMGSAICFPILALCVWSILTAGSPDKDTASSILVYGDDVIVPTAFAESAITLLESFGLLVNRDKSCMLGFFRESCGMDAFQGVDVTPVRLRRPWHESPHPDAFESWISYANSFFKWKYYRTYDYIVGLLESVYGSIPTKDMNISCPSLDGHTNLVKFRKRTNRALQKTQFYVRVTQPVKVRYMDTDWIELLRYFTDFSSIRSPVPPTQVRASSFLEPRDPVSIYTKRKQTKFVWRWR